MSFKLYTLIVLLIVISCNKATKLPPYFSQCSKTDPRLNECLVHNANGGLYTFVKGDKAYNIQPLLPLFIPHMSIDIDKQLKLNLTNSIVSELDGAKVKDAKCDFENNHMEFSMYMPRATLLGQYTIKGQISILPIHERGPVNITIGNVINSSLNEHWLETNSALAPSITEALCNITTKNLRGFFEKVPIEELMRE